MNTALWTLLLFTPTVAAALAGGRIAFRQRA